MWLLIKKIMSLTFGVHWKSEKESFGKPKRNSTEEKLIQSQYNGTRINMIHKDRGNHLWWITSNAEILGHSLEDLIWCSFAYHWCPRSCLHDWSKKHQFLGCQDNDRGPRSQARDWPFVQYPLKTFWSTSIPWATGYFVFLRISLISCCLSLAQVLCLEDLDTLLTRLFLFI